MSLSTTDILASWSLSYALAYIIPNPKWMRGKHTRWNKSEQFASNCCWHLSLPSQLGLTHHIAINHAFLFKVITKWPHIYKRIHREIFLRVLLSQWDLCCSHVLIDLENFEWTGDWLRGAGVGTIDKLDSPPPSVCPRQNKHVFKLILNDLVNLCNWTGKPLCPRPSLLFW